MCSVHAAQHTVTLQSQQPLEAKVVFMLGWYLIGLTWNKLPASTHDRFICESTQSEKWHLSTFHQSIWHLNNWFWLNSEKCHYAYGKPAIGLKPQSLPFSTMALPVKLLSIYVLPHLCLALKRLKKPIHILTSLMQKTQKKSILRNRSQSLEMWAIKLLENCKGCKDFKNSRSRCG